MNIFCRFGMHKWHFLLSEVGWIPLRGWPVGTVCMNCGIAHPKPLRKPILTEPTTTETTNG